MTARGYVFFAARYSTCGNEVTARAGLPRAAGVYAVRLTTPQLRVLICVVDAIAELYNVISSHPVTVAIMVTGFALSEARRLS